MKAVVYHGPGDRRLENVPDPRIEDPNDVIVRVSTSTICGTDLHILRGDVHPRLLPPSPFNRMAATVSPRTSQKRLRNPLGKFVPANMSSRENLMTRSTARQRFGHETLSNKNSRYALQASPS